VDAITFLSGQHRQLEKLFSRYESNSSRHFRLNEIERLLSVHSLLEEHYVYPLIARAGDLDELLAQARQEHTFLRALLDDMAVMAPRTPQYDCCMRRLIAAMRQHMRQEEAEGGLMDRVRALGGVQRRSLGRTLRVAALAMAAPRGQAAAVGAAPAIAVAVAAHEAVPDVA
jgi:hypothetical protein